MHCHSFLRKAALLGAALGLLVPALAGASSHREAPLISQDPEADNTDVYAFVSPDAPNTVTIVANYVPMEEPAGGPNFFKFGDDVLYEIHVDNNGDARSDLDFQFAFKTSVQNPNTFLYNTGPIHSLTDPNWNVRQSYNVMLAHGGNFVSMLASGLPTPPVNIGPASTPDYENLAEQATQTLPDGIKVFCGQRDDPFFVDLGGVFDLLTIRVLPGDQGGGIDGLGGYNCQTIAMQIPISLLTKDGKIPGSPGDPDAVIGVWATASRRQVATQVGGGNPPSPSGPWVQVSRLGMPLVNEVVVPLGEKDKWNNSLPKDDGQFLSYVTDPELAGLLHALYGLNVPLHGRDDLVAVFLTGISGLNQPPNVTPCEEMRLNVAIPPTDRSSPNFSRLGVLGGNLDGFPNGRRLEDDVTDIELRAVAGVTYKLFHPDWPLDPLANRLGDGVDHNDEPFLDHFPYVAVPFQGFADTHQPPYMQNSNPGAQSVQLGEASPVQGANSAPAVANGFSNSPNPFKGSTTIAYSVSSAGPVKVEVLDVMGRRVQTLVNQMSSAGSHQVSWDGTDVSGRPVPNGTYFYRVQDGGSVEARKMVLSR